MPKKRCGHLKGGRSVGFSALSGGSKRQIEGSKKWSFEPPSAGETTAENSLNQRLIRLWRKIVELVLEAAHAVAVRLTVRAPADRRVVQEQVP